MKFTIKVEVVKEQPLAYLVTLCCGKNDKPTYRGGNLEELLIMAGDRISFIQRVGK